MGSDGQVDVQRTATVSPGGYRAATLGALAGGALLGAICALIGYQIGVAMPYEYSNDGFTISPDLNLQPVIVGFAGFAIGLWLGEVLGCWLALRRRGFVNAGWTAGLLGAIQIVWMPIWVIAFTALTRDLYAALLSSVVFVVAMPLLSRWLAQR